MPTQTRQLAAIMFTDIVGYTALMQINEENALAKVERYKEVQIEKIKKYEGNTLKYYGDGSLTIFKSVLNAVNCAMEIQQSLQKSPKVSIRIGIHTGDVLSRDGDVYGDGINIAARLQSFGEEGSIVFSGDVRDKIKNHPELKSVYLGKHQLKNVLSDIDIYALSNPGVKVPIKSQVPESKDSEIDKNIKKPLNAKIKSSAYYIIGISIFIALSVFIGFIINQRQEKQYALHNALPDLINSANEINQIEGKMNWEIYLKSKQIAKYVKKNPEFIQLWNDITFPLTIKTNTVGASVYAKPYSNPDTSWFFLGKTPMVNYNFPKGMSRIKIEKSGFETQHDVLLKQLPRPVSVDTLYYRLFRKDEIPEEMVFVPSQMGNYWSTPGLPSLLIEDFWIDRFEVTNKQYKIFLDSAGYNNPNYWPYAFIDNGDTLLFENAIKQFKDKTGWPGPANWELSDYPKNEGDIPVTGISWYEAVAYAKFKNKELPTLFHWTFVSEPHAAPEIVKFGNYNGKGPASGYTYNSMTRFGTYDLPGNVSEWIFNSNQNKRFVMGGNYKEPSYLYNTTYIQMSPWERNELVGFRCIKYNNTNTWSQLTQNFDQVKRDYNNLKPVSDEIFQVYKDLLKFEKRELNPVQIETSESEYWNKETIEVAVSYDDEPMKILIFLPKNYKSPFQTILYFPGLSSHFSNDIGTMQIDDNIDFFLKSGRAVIWPVYYASHGRGTTHITNINLWKQAYRYIIQDVQITLDYLQIRNDIDIEKIVYYGISWGGAVAPYILSIEDRINLGIVALFGVSSFKKYLFKEFDPVDYLPHVEIPMLLLGGQYDFDFTIEQQRAFYDLLGTPEADKNWMVFESTHYIPHHNLVSESLNWLDKYFGKVEKSIE